MLISCATSNDPVVSADLKIPNQPDCVKATRTAIMKGPLNPAQSKRQITMYERSEDANIRAINCGTRFHKKIQGIYNK